MRQDSPLPVGNLVHEEGKGSVLFTAMGLADTYSRPGVRAAAQAGSFHAARLLDAIRSGLSAATAKEVIPHVREDPKILGGIVVRIGDRVMDGSVRKRLKTLKARIVAAR